MANETEPISEIKAKQDVVLREASRKAWKNKEIAQRNMLREREIFVDERSPPYSREQMYQTWDWQMRDFQAKLHESYRKQFYDAVIEALSPFPNLVVDGKIVENLIGNRQKIMEEKEYEDHIEVTSCSKCGHTIFVHPSVPKEDRICAHCTPGYFSTNADKNAIAMSTGRKAYKK